MKKNNDISHTEKSDLTVMLHDAATDGDSETVKAIIEVMDREETRKLLDEMDNDELS